MLSPTIVYNSYTLPNVTGPYTFNQTATDFTFSCRFLLTAATSSGLTSAEKTMLAAMDEVKRTFTASFGSSEFSFIHDTTGGTGYNARVTVTKIGSPNLSTATSRDYSFTIALQLPYTQDSGRIAANMDISYTPARQVIAAFSGLYSANTTTNALEVATVDTWAATTLTAMFSGRVFEIVGEKYHQDHNLKRVTVHKVYKEVITPPTSTANLNKVVDGELNFGLTFTTSSGAMLTADTVENQLCTLNLSYRGYFDKEVVTDQKTMAGYWQTDIRVRLLVLASDYLKTTTYGYSDSLYIIERENVLLNPNNYTIQANMSITCKTRRNYLAAVAESITTYKDSGLKYIKLWDGQPNTYHMWSLGEVTVMTRRVGKLGIDFVPTLEKLPPGFGLEDKTAAWILLNTLEMSSKRRSGQEVKTTGAKQYNLHEKTWVETYLCTNKASETTVILGDKKNGS